MGNLKIKIVESPILLTILIGLILAIVGIVIQQIDNTVYQNVGESIGYKLLLLILLLLVCSFFASIVYYRHKIKTLLFLDQPKQSIALKSNKKNNLIISFIAPRSIWTAEIQNGKQAISIHAEFLITNVSDKENSITTVEIKKYGIVKRTTIKLQNMRQSMNVFEVVKTILPDKTYDFTAEKRIYREHPKPNKHLYLDFYFEDKFGNKYLLKNILFDAQHRRNRPEKAN